jgi:preprotein translocase subunit SecF
MAAVAHKSDDQVSTSSVGPTWGGQITNKAIEALVVFFIAVIAYISIRFEPKMAAAAFIAMVHDLLVTIGVYSLFGFQITPDTVIAILTILGYSLYDTVVVFDRVRDNTQGVLKGGELTYSDMVNLSMNQTLARSINTSLVAILPVLAVLLIGADLLGATTLQDYGLALFVGLMSGAYSSIFIASPLLAWMKEREPRYRDLAARVNQRTDRRILTATSAAMAGAQATVANARPQRTGSSSAAIQARARKRTRR